ncbi:uncharacterized protein EI90DRAFT_3067829 [Cantharellus anzutake]|uniref:uncharacterized protein n=1 Tax=Cantharellus anzutake TaxID=1750568 RepID=UPI001902FA69|nr:uncharacterized protein EI90DRAFT_3067829 [Cantharellus anzutake]KAF8327449.1 hypothetical protein EI90DRAFT_3067829 [Cantharellus anzutake]
MHWLHNRCQLSKPLHLVWGHFLPPDLVTRNMVMFLAGPRYAPRLESGCQYDIAEFYSPSAPFRPVRWSVLLSFWLMLTVACLSYVASCCPVVPSILAQG